MSFPAIMETMVKSAKQLSFLKNVKCEFLVTTFYVLIGCGSTITGNTRCKTNSDELKAAITFGMLAVTLLFWSLRSNSLAQMNPAISIAMLCTRKTDVVTVLFNILAQCVGAIAGAGILYGVTPARFHELLGVTYVHSDIEVGQAFGIEFLITFVMTYSYFAILHYPGCTSSIPFEVLPVGFSITTGHTFGWKYTGASMNPARSLGPAVVCNSWANHWVYWIGPILGAILGGITFEYSHTTYPDVRQLRRSSSTQLDRVNLEEPTDSKESVELPTELTFSMITSDDPEV